MALALRAPAGAPDAEPGGLAERLARAEAELDDTRAMLRSLMESTTDGILIVDLRGRVTQWNQRFLDMWRLAPARAGESGRALMERAAEQLVDPAPPPCLAPDVESHEVLEFRDGRVFERYSQPLRAAGRAVGRVWSFSDVSEHRFAERVLRESEQRYALAVRGASDGIWDWDLAAADLYLSPRCGWMLGEDGNGPSAGPRAWLRRVHPADRAGVADAVRAHLAGLTPHLESEHRMRHLDGGWRWVRVRGVAVRDAAGRAVRMAGSQSDATASKEAEERLVHNARHDAMTGLPNRAHFMERLRAGIERAARGDERFTVLFLDLDGFKVVNDSLGHLAGDELLAAVGRRLAGCVPEGDWVARLGGDEFAVLLSGAAGVPEAVRVCRSIEAALAAPFVAAGREVFTSASIGIAPGRGTGSAEDVLREADTAMYRAKAAGRGGYEVFDDAMHQRAVLRLQMETDLRRGVERGEVEAVYQPVVSLADGRLAGFEALARWRHPERGLLAPAEFIPLAEDTGLVVPLGLRVLRVACAQATEWNRRSPAAPLSVSVNLSARQMSAPGFVATVAAVLAETGVEPRCLTLEITESMLAVHPEAAEATLAELKALGVRLAVDDFGTGYSSLSYLHRFPIDELKIDRSFVSRMEGASGGLEIVRTVLALAANLGLRAVAEGVETATQREMLRSLGCDFAQGYLFSPPVDADAAEAMWRAWPLPSSI